MLWKLSLEAKPPEKRHAPRNDEDEDGQAALVLREGREPLAAPGPGLVHAARLRCRRRGDHRLTGLRFGHRVPLPRAM